MNDGVLVSVHGYAGDQHQMQMLLPWYGHHERPVLVLSPEDSPVTDIGPGGVFYRQGGKRAYIGPDSLLRQVRHMEILLEQPPEYDWFLMHDSDSVCLQAELPRYLFTEPETFWSNLVIDDIPGRPWPVDDCPRLAFQPPYFTSRAGLKKLIAASPAVTIDPVRPFIDRYMVQLAARAGIPYKRFEYCASCETVTPLGKRLMMEQVQNNGVIFCHAIKSPDSLQMIVDARKEYLRSHR